VDTKFVVAAGKSNISARIFYPLRRPGRDIHEANTAAGLAITESNVDEYVRFFMAHLRDDAGELFAIIESLNGYRLGYEDGQTRQKPEDTRFAYDGVSVYGDTFAFRVM